MRGLILVSDDVEFGMVLLLGTRSVLGTRSILLEH